MTTETASPKSSQALIPQQLQYALWRRVDKRLRRGDVLITTEHFEEVMVREFRKLIHVPPSKRIRAAIHEMIVSVNEEHPQTFLSLGIKNAVTRYFRDLEKNMEGKQTEVLDEARQRIKQLIREGNTMFFLESIGVEVGSKGVPASVERAIERIVSGERLKAEPQVERRSQRRRAAKAERAEVHVSEAAKAREEEEGTALVGLPDQKERAERIEKMKNHEKRLAEEEMKRARKHLDSYVDQDLLDEEEAKTLHELYDIDDRLANGEIDQEEADRLRGQYDAGARGKLEQRLQKAVDYAVQYINAFESLKRIPSSRDPALKLLIRHKDLLMEEDPGADMSAATEELEGEEDTLESLTRIMERRENEARMISANMPPYRYVNNHGKIGNLVIEEDFIDGLREMGREELSEQLNSPDKEVRIKPAAEIRCMLELIDRAILPSPFNRAVRRLKIRQTIVKLYSGGDSKSGRHKVQYFVNQRVLRLYPDIEPPEKAEIDAESQQIMAGIDAEREGGDSKGGLRIYRA